MRIESEMEEKKGERVEKGRKRQAELREKEKGEKCGYMRRESALEEKKEERRRGK
jgi:hypothetical protein